ncbi:3-oxoacyl-[acyl-carrier-protein] reductase FabG [Variovorax sp. PBL-H6]|uniref:SDR family NAD(P)-dependent oxidoreductase n=1 Tax=Variovorax sp. PBL-H6 TaxID=434009 RepID=UPI0013165D87|nr:SDR family NAD(P)-dependent oxidoreductase [Variovorax sp. PBL-H6]VTU16201.1 3-oxoacyl-[acyl-carrier-protein] reductase FabG [Variovorax sp. PBL-H6]
MNQFEGRTAIVTGAATGIGAATAATLAREGAIVCIMDMNREGAEESARAITEEGGRAEVRIVDLGSWEQTRDAIDGFAKAHGRLDIVVHSAGGFPAYVSLIDCPVEAWDPVVNSNLRSMFYLLKAAAPHMMERNFGRFVSLSSMAARSGVNPNPPHYTAAKGGMLALTRQAARDLGPHGITVNAVAPANVETPRTLGIRSAERIAHIQRTTPLGRLAQPQEIANAVVWLASPQASYVTGITMDVNGGATMI